MRRFELSDGKSHKFWEIGRTGSVVEVRFGRMGTTGQTQQKTHASPSAAELDVEGLVRSKLKKGYREVRIGARAAPLADPNAARGVVKAVRSASKGAPAPTSSNLDALAKAMKRPKADWRALRRSVAARSPAERTALVAQAKALAETGNVTLRSNLAAIFEQPAWVERDLCERGDGPLPDWLGPIVVSYPTIAEAASLLKRADIQIEFPLVEELIPVRDDLVDRYGDSAAPFLISLMSSVESGGQTVPLARSLSRVETALVAEHFVKCLATASLRAVASEYLVSHPRLALGPLSRAAVSPGKNVERARALLRTVVSSGISTDDPALSPAVRALIASFAPSRPSSGEASSASLPSVLRTPPWTTPVDRAPAATVELSPLDFADTMSWKPGEPASWLVDAEPVASSPSARKRLLATIRAANASTPKKNERVWDKGDAWAFATVPTDDLRAILPDLRPSRFNWKDWRSSLHKQIIARHGAHAVGLVAAAAAEEPEKAIAALARANSARVAPLMADAFVRRRKSKDEGARWLAAFPEAAAVGLIPAALGKPGLTRASAEQALRYVAARGHRGVIDSVARRYGKAAKAGLDGILDHHPLHEAGARLPVMPAFWSPAAFARPILRGTDRPLPRSALDTIGTLLALTSFDEPHPWLFEVRDACDRQSLAAFAWDVFQAWLLAGGSPKHEWALLALSVFGDDDTARKLAPVLRTWPGEGAIGRTAVGLDVLTRMGSDVALLHLFDLSKRLNAKTLQAKALANITELAESRGLTADDLADRLIPTLGLDARGEATLDYGSRQFRVAFDESLRPWVTDAVGARLPDLPRPKRTDTRAKAASAIARWQSLRKDAKRIASTLLGRLEQAMCGQRRFRPDVFATCFAGHPLVVHLARRLVWGAFVKGSLTTTFRVAEDGSLADADDRTFALPAGVEVGVVHRLELSDPVARAWEARLADYEIVQPFPQLGRDTQRPAEAERSARKLTRVMKHVVAPAMLFGLERRGYVRSVDDGVVWAYEKPLRDGAAARLSFEPGIELADMKHASKQTLGDVTLTTDETFQSVNDVAFSELLRDLAWLRS